MKQLIVAETRVVSANREVTFEAGLPEICSDTAKLGKKILEDKRKPNYQWRARQKSRSNLGGAVADVDHFNSATALLEHGRQVSHAKITLILVANEHHVGARPGRDDGIF
jgi:hypothetical protein